MGNGTKVMDGVYQCDYLTKVGTMRVLCSYEGEFFKGQRHGPGILTLPNGERHGNKHLFFLLFYKSFSFVGCQSDGQNSDNKKHGPGWWRFTNGKVRPGEWKDDVLVRWTGPEQFEAQMKAKRIKPK